MNSSCASYPSFSYLNDCNTYLTSLHFISMYLILFNC
nr:MAG TPA: hypothetical protein [Caudoviricetes sp.]